MNALEGKVALVTGSGRGLGEAICRTLGRAGMKVLAADIRFDLADAVAHDIAAGGGAAEAVRLDVGVADEAASAVAHAIRRHGRLDVLVNNAGVDLTVSIEELTVADWDRILCTNLRGPFLLSKAALGEMRERRSGHIVNVVSTAAKRAWANAAAYHASKWGLLGFSHALHVEARRHGVKVTAVIAGGMRTPFLLERFPDIDPSTLQDPACVARAIHDVLLLPEESVVPEITVLPMRESSWP
jgi:NAD(P)-dependent dehydrogenase (short-subunit alcohol dehydrogenase family)